MGITLLFIFIQGFFSLPIMTVAEDFGVELTFPIGESYSTGLILTTGMIFGIANTYICSQILDSYGSDITGVKIVYLIFAVMAILAAICIMFVTQDLKRQRFEREKEAAKKGE